MSMKTEHNRKMYITVAVKGSEVLNKCLPCLPLNKYIYQYQHASFSS